MIGALLTDGGIEMPNGYEMTAEKYESLDRAMRNIDVMPRPFAEEIKAGVATEFHCYPCRRLELKSIDGMFKTIDISPITLGGGASEENPHYYIVGVMVWRDNGNARTLWDQEVARFMAAQMTPDTVLPALVRAWEILKPIDAEFLKRHGKVSKNPYRGKHGEAQTGGDAGPPN
jgi:hypothetical protein